MIVILGELYSSKNSRRILRAGDKVYISKSKAAKEQEEELLIQLIQQRAIWQQMTQDLEYPLIVKFKIYRKTQRKCDYLNIVQGLCDAMVLANYFPDDNYDYLLPAFSPMQFDKLNPRTILSL